MVRILNNWNENFRGDGYRGVCPECNEHFTINHNQTFKSALILHFLDNHNDRVLKAVTYVDAIMADIKKDVKK